MPGLVRGDQHFMHYVIMMSCYFWLYDSSFRIALMIPNDKLNIACNR